MTQLYFDLETLPSGNKPTMEEMKLLVPKNYKKEEAITAWCAENVDAVYRKRALSSHRSQICVIGFSFGGDKISSIYGDDEKKLMIAFNDILKDMSTMELYSMEWIGHNIASFDIPILWLRACKYNLRPLKSCIPHNKADTPRIVDTMKMFGATDYRSMVSLDDCSKFFGLEGKGNIDGSKVYDIWNSGEKGKRQVVRYCEQDVHKVIQLYDKMI